MSSNMDDKITELKDKQQIIGDKITQLQQTNKKKDEEAAEIRRLIAECRQNLNRIKNVAPDADTAFVLPPCTELDNFDPELRRALPVSQTPPKTEDKNEKPERNRCAELLAKKECKSFPSPCKKSKNGKDKVFKT